MIIDLANKWNPGDVIGVKFLNGNENLKQRVESTAKIWENFANIKFDFTTPNASIRIKFDSPSNDSKIGTEFLTFPDPVTMNFANLHENSSDEELNHKILHEFGHALGLVHEHFHPDFKQNLKFEKIMSHFKRNIGLSEAEVKQNVLKEYCANQLSYSEFDPESIMTYDIPAACTKNGIELKRNAKLSELDKKYISMVYPSEPVLHQDLQVENTFEFNSPYEEKIYKFLVVPADRKRYYITSESNNPIALSLFRIENEGERNGQIEYLKPYEMNNESIGNQAKIDLDDYATNFKPSITEYFVRVIRTNPFDTCEGKLKFEEI